MRLFSKKPTKIKFDARGEWPDAIKTNPEGWEYTHNFKVHYKSSRLQVLASKLNLSVPSNTPKLPSHNEVEAAANERLMGSTFTVQHGVRTPGRLGKKDLTFSYHITNAEYKETIAFMKGQDGW